MKARWGCIPPEKPSELSAERLLPADQVEFGGLNLLGSLRYDDYRSVTTNYLQNGDKAYVLRIGSPNVWGRFTRFRRDFAVHQLFRGLCAGIPTGDARRQRREANSQQAG
ncbi:hypothetical protein ACP3P6_18205 [Enterobacter mori]